MNKSILFLLVLPILIATSLGTSIAQADQPSDVLVIDFAWGQQRLTRVAVNPGELEQVLSSDDRPAIILQKDQSVDGISVSYRYDANYIGGVAKISNAQIRDLDLQSLFVRLKHMAKSGGVLLVLGVGILLLVLSFLVFSAALTGSVGVVSAAFISMGLLVVGLVATMAGTVLTTGHLPKEMNAAKVTQQISTLTSALSRTKEAQAVVILCDPGTSRDVIGRISCEGYVKATQAVQSLL